MPDRRRRPRRLWAGLALVLANAALLFVVLGTSQSLEQHERVLDPDTLDACAAELFGSRASRYALHDARFDGPNTVRADFYPLSASADRPLGAKPDPPPQQLGSLRCTVSAGEEVADPMSVVRVEQVP